MAGTSAHVRCNQGVSAKAPIGKMKSVAKGWRTVVTHPRQTAILLPLALLVTVSIVLCISAAEIRLCQPFFRGHATVWTWEGKWASLINEYSIYPPIALGVTGLCLVVASYLRPAWRGYRNSGWFLAFVLAVGPGLLANGVMKPLWGRPRPEELREFGGKDAYHPVWKLKLGGDSRSFPSGHAAVAFAMMAPAFLAFGRSRRLFLALAALGIIYGSAVGFARIAQGAHFPSDVLWSAGIVYFTSVGTYLALGLHPRSPLVTDKGVASSTSCMNR